MEFFSKDFCIRCEQIRSLHCLKKFLMENVIFLCSVYNRSYAIFFVSKKSVINLNLLQKDVNSSELENFEKTMMKTQEHLRLDNLDNLITMWLYRYFSLAK